MGNPLSGVLARLFWEFLESGFFFKNTDYPIAQHILDLLTIYTFSYLKTQKSNR